MKIRIAGGGPAGLIAAYLLAKKNEDVEVYEMERIVGGIAKTKEYKGYRFDVGGHRFFTKAREVEDLWHELMPQDFLKRPRQSRIFYRKHFFDYPLKPVQAFFGLGAVTSFLMFASYVWIRIRPLPQEENLEEWVTNRFGRKLYETFFKTYTEKVWGIPCTEIQAEWVAQRIKGLSLTSAVKNAVMGAILPSARKQKSIKTLISEFEYPRLGPGQMWEICTKRIEEMNGSVIKESRVTTVYHDNNRITAFEVTYADGRTERKEGDKFISTMPIRELVNSMDPAPRQEILTAASHINYRDFFTVALIINKRDIFTDNWIYIHDPDIVMGRIQNFKNWSPDLVADPNKTCLGLEYFAFENDDLWNKSDEELIELGKQEVVKLGFARPEEIEDGTVVRQLKAYPVYDKDYKTHLETIKTYLATFQNLYLIGRNGMHKYNNQDHSMLTAMRAVENMYGANHNLWEVNADEEYHEEHSN